MSDRITLAAETPATASPAERTISGRILTFGVPSSSQRVTIEAGALSPRDPLHRVKLLIDHDHAQPVGVLTKLDITDTDAVATFTLPDGPASDAALASAKAGLRDGLSIGIAVQRARRDDSGAITVSAAELVEVSLVAVPDFADASVTTVTASAEGAKTMTETKQPETKQPEAKQPETKTAVDLDSFSTPPALEVSQRAMSFSGAVRTMSDAINSGNLESIRLALSDIVPSMDAGQAWLRDTWIGELFTATPVERWWIDAFGPTQQLDSLKGKGWHWTDRPKPAKYSGNKAEVPSNTIGTEEVEFTAERWAGGWDIDRAFIDLGSGDFLSAFWQAAMAEYRAASNADIGKKIVASATKSKATPKTVLAAIKALAAELREIGATPTSVFLATDLFDAFSELRADEVPFWLSNVVGGVNVSAGTVGQPGGLSLKIAPDLAAGTVLALDKRAAIIREKTPIRVNGVDIGRGGIDLGFFSYGRLDLHDPRAVRKVTVTDAS